MNFTRMTLLAVALMLSGCIAGERSVPRVRIATTTSLENSGLLEQMRIAFRSDTGIEIEAHVVGSGKALQLARDGTVELAITHEPEGEAELARTGRVEEQALLMANSFILVGPPGNPAGVLLDATVVDAMRLVHSAEAIFVSRGDESGTHVREMELWAGLDLDPERNEGYRRMGQGMSALLRSASELQGYALTDDTTFEAMKPVLRLEEFAGGGNGSANVYSVTLLRERAGRASPEARAFYDWLLSERGQELIGAFRRGSKGSFVPREKVHPIS
ncbi:MAG: substrate-binding domain-containing protein [Thermoanaerobaculia bacterium]